MTDNLELLWIVKTPENIRKLKEADQVHLNDQVLIAVPLRDKDSLWVKELLKGKASRRANR